MSIRVGLRHMARSAVYRPAIYDAFRKSHEIDGSAAGAQTDYHIPIKVRYSGHFADNGMEDPLYFANYPSAVYYNGKTYIVWQGDAGYDPYIISYDHATDTWADAVKVGTNPLSDDSSGAPVILIDNSGYIHVFYGAHNTNLKYAKSDNPEDITAWTAQADPTANCSYPNVIPDNGNIHLLYRATVGSYGPWAYRLSDDNGASWGAEAVIIEIDAGDGIYSYMPQLHGTKIHMVWRYWDDSESKALNVYHAYLELSDGHMYSMDGTDLGTSISKAEADANCLIVNSGAYMTFHMALHLDESGYPYVIYCLETVQPLAEFDINFTRWNGSEWVTPETIAETDEALNAMDFIVHSATSITAFLVGSGAAGRGGDIVKWSWDGATWTEVKTILSEAEAGMPLQDPKVVINYDDEIKLVFTEYGAGAGGLKVYASDGSELVSLQDSGENIYCDGKCKTDFGDIRFTDSDGTTELEHWLEEKVDSDYALFWVKIPNIPADPDTRTIYVYYGKDDATSASTESREDFTGYTEVEEIDDIQKTAHHVDFVDSRGRTTYLYKDYTADYFTDFACHLNIKRVTHGAAAAIRYILMANVVDGQQQMIGVDAHLYSAIGGDDPKITMYEWESDGTPHACDPELTDEVTLGTMYYQSLRKYGTALVLDTYTTAAKRLAGGNGDFGHQTLILTVDYSFQYNYVGNTYDSGTAQAGSSDMEDLFLRKYVSPEPANGDWGSEEDIVWPF